MRVKGVFSSILKHFFLTPLLILRGRFCCRRIFPKSETLYVLAFQGLGDSLVTLGFLESYAKKHGFCHAEIFCTERYEEFYSFYDFNFAKKRVVSPRVFKTVKRFFLTESGLSYLLAHKNILFADTAVYLGRAWKATFRMGEISVFSYIKKAIMALGDEADFRLPNIPQAALPETLLGKKIAVLNEKSNTIKLSSVRSLFEEIASLLRSKDFCVVTDVGKGGVFEAVQGTQVFKGTLAQSFSLCKNAALIVGVRSGYLDLMVLTETPILAIYPDDCKVQMNAFDLNALRKISGRSASKTVFQCRAKDALSELKKII